MNPDQPVEKLVYDSAYDRFLDNVVIKARSENYVTYEYKDVRVDELAPIASRYCLEHGNRTAVLRSVILYKIMPAAPLLTACACNRLCKTLYRYKEIKIANVSVKSIRWEKIYTAF